MKRIENESFILPVDESNFIVKHSIEGLHAIKLRLDIDRFKLLIDADIDMGLWKTLFQSVTVYSDENTRANVYGEYARRYSLSNIDIFVSYLLIKFLDTDIFISNVFRSQFEDYKNIMDLAIRETNRRYLIEKKGELEGTETTQERQQDILAHIREGVKIFNSKNES